jgi:hypothetical protein
MRAISPGPLAALLLLSTFTAHAQEWIPGDGLNDPKKEEVCKEDAAKHYGAKQFSTFEINARFVANSRAADPDATFVVGNSGSFKCTLNPGTGRFGVVQSGGIPIRIIRPQKAGTGIRGRQDQERAVGVCLTAARLKDPRSDFDHSAWWLAVDVGPGSRMLQQRIGGTAPEQYDIVVNGTLYFKTAGLDLAVNNYSCLLTPQFELKKIEIGIHDRRRFPLTE